MTKICASKISHIIVKAIKLHLLSNFQDNNLIEANRFYMHIQLDSRALSGPRYEEALSFCLVQTLFDANLMTYLNLFLLPKIISIYICDF